jgi:DNA-binding transcriptional LysR family regulator
LPIVHRWVFLVARDNPEVGDQLTMADLATLPWAAYQCASDALAARQLIMIGVEPRVEVSADSFQLLPFLITGTRRVALIQESLAAVLRGVAQVRVMRPPYDAVPLQEAMWWHPVHTHDAAHVWLRETVARVGEARRRLCLRPGRSGTSRESAGRRRFCCDRSGTAAGSSVRTPLRHVRHAPKVSS